MESEAKEDTSDIVYRGLAWADKNRKPLAVALIAVVAVGSAIGLYSWNKDRTETQASEAVSNLKVPGAVTGTNASSAESFLKLAQENAGTTGGARALLIGANVLFEKGDFAQAQAKFEQFLQSYPESPLANQAALGVAASLEAQGKNDLAATKYKEFIDRHDRDPSLTQAKSALARLYVALSKPELAYKIYDELEHGGGNDSWTAEARIQKSELLEKFPNLNAPKPVPAPTTSAPATSSIAPATTPPITTTPSTNKP